MTRSKQTNSFTYDDARRFYNRLGSLQDSQHFYEDPALRKLRAHAEFNTARAVVEFGCGTGRLAEQLLKDDLAPDAKYLGFDISQTMVDLARKRTKIFGERVEIRLIDGTPRLNVADSHFDRFISVYVLDLLSTEDRQILLSEARRVLEPNGKVALASLTHGRSGFSRAVSWGWERLHQLQPSIVGGCQPIDLQALFNAEQWDIEYHDVIAPFAIPQEIIVAARL